MVRSFRIIKPEIRVLGVDDGVFKPRTRGYAPVVGVVFRGGLWLDGVLHTRVRVDGFDATRKIAEMILESPHRKQLRVIMLNGVTFAGFNVVDIRRLSQLTTLPVIALSRDKPDFEQIRRALMNLSHPEKRWKALVGTDELHVLKPSRGKGAIYIQVWGLSPKDAGSIVEATSTRSGIPEPLRVAHLIASGISS